MIKKLMRKEIRRKYLIKFLAVVHDVAFYEYDEILVVDTRYKHLINNSYYFPIKYKREYVERKNITAEFKEKTLKDVAIKKLDEKKINLMENIKRYKKKYSNIKSAIYEDTEEYKKTQAELKKQIELEKTIQQQKINKRKVENEYKEKESNDNYMSKCDFCSNQNYCKNSSIKLCNNVNTEHECDSGSGTNDDYDYDWGFLTHYR